MTWYARRGGDFGIRPPVNHPLPLSVRHLRPGTLMPSFSPSLPIDRRV